MSSMMGYSRDAYYKRLSRTKRVDDSREVVLSLVNKIREDEPRVGTRKLHHRVSPELESRGIRVGRDKMFDVLREEEMLVKPKKCYQRTTYSKHGYAVAPNRVKELEVFRVNQVYVSDITYISLHQGFAYLFLVTDAYSRKIVGYHLSKDLSHHSAIIALSMALEGVEDAAGIIHHSDRGCQYCCHSFLSFLGEYGVVPSMTDENHCYQNAIAERVNGILKDEFDIDSVFCSFLQAQQSVKKAICVYNTKRTHWSLNLKTPMQVHQEVA